MTISGVSYYQPLYSVDTGQNSNTANEQDGQNGNNQTQTKNQNRHELTHEQKMQVIELQQRDIEVRMHEAAHIAAGAGLTTGATYSYQRGPDNKMYAIGGEVGIDTSPGSTAQETLKKAGQIKRAALAPAQPSPADLQVAATATNMEIDAKIEIQKEQLEDKKKEQKSDNSSQDRANLDQSLEQKNQNRVNNPYALNYDYSIRTIGLF